MDSSEVGGIDDQPVTASRSLKVLFLVATGHRLMGMRIRQGTTVFLGETTTHPAGT